MPKDEQDCAEATTADILADSATPNNENIINETGGNSSYWSYFGSTKIAGYIPYLKNSSAEDNFTNNADFKDRPVQPAETVDNYDKIKKEIQLLTSIERLYRFFDLLINKKIIMLSSVHITDEEKAGIFMFVELANILLKTETFDLSPVDDHFVKLHYTKLIEVEYKQDDFKEEYQPFLLENLNSDIRNLDLYNRKELLKQYSLFQSDNTIVDNKMKFSKTSAETQSESSGESIAALQNDDNGSPANLNKFYNILNTPMLLSKIQGTLNSVYTRNIYAVNDSDIFLNNNNPDKIALQIYGEEGDTRLLLEYSLSWHLGGIRTKTEYSSLKSFQISPTSDEGLTATAKKHLKIDDSVLLPSRDVDEYFHKRTIWSKIGLGLREHYKLDNGDLHLYLNSNYFLKQQEKVSFNDKPFHLPSIFNSKQADDHITEKIHNLIIGFHIVDVATYGNGDDQNTSFSFKSVVEGCAKQVDHLLKEQHDLQNDERVHQIISTKRVSIEIPVITKDSVCLDRLLERLQNVFIQLVRLDVFKDVDNLFVTTNGESFNLLVLLFPYLNSILNLRCASNEFPYKKYPVNQSFFSNSFVNLKKIGILGLDVNTELSPLYFLNDDPLSSGSFFEEALNWCAQTNIKISIVSNLYDCKKFALTDKLLIDMLHPNIIRGIYVQNRVLNYDFNNFEDADDSICLKKVPLDRQFEIRLISLLLHCLNSGYVSEDTIPLLKMISSNFQSRAFNKLTLTSSLKKKWDKMNREFVAQMDRVHLDWKSMDPWFIFQNLDSKKKKFEFLNYWMIKKELLMLGDELLSASHFDVSQLSILNDPKVFDFFINNTLFTSDVYINKKILKYDRKELTASLANDEEKQFLLIWKLRDFVTNFLSVRNLPSSMNNLFLDASKMQINIMELGSCFSFSEADRMETVYTKNTEVSTTLLIELFELYLVYVPPENNRNLSAFKSEILDMIWDNYETSSDFLEDISS